MHLPETPRCQYAPCGKCAPCRQHAMVGVAEYAIRMEKVEEGDPGAVLLDLLEKLGLTV